MLCLRVHVVVCVFDREAKTYTERQERETEPRKKIERERERERKKIERTKVREDKGGKENSCRERVWLGLVLDILPAIALTLCNGILSFISFPTIPEFFPNDFFLFLEKPESPYS